MSLLIIVGGTALLVSFAVHSALKSTRHVQPEPVRIRVEAKRRRRR
ncbi:MAG: hypothetical protein HQL50_00335 [Magnetococcales bacterium]|nr:hypothetical protein [Magnetococcales bacterium]